MTVFVNVDFGNPPSPEPQQKKRRMPPKKKNPPRQQHQPPPVQPPPVSDYETDAANYTDNAAQQINVPAPPPNRTNEELNMLVLKRWYPEIEQILAIAPFAVIYSCHPVTQEWDKLELQGSLFVCQTSPGPGGFPRYKAILLNRRHMGNWEVDLISTENIDVQGEFVILTVFENVDGGDEEDFEMAKIYGAWMYQDTEGGKEVIDGVVKIILDCAKRAEQFAQLTLEETGDEGSGYEEYQQGYDQYEYGLDGMPRGQSFQAEQQAYQEPPQQHQPQQSEQKIDLAALFGKPQQAQQPPTQGSQDYRANVDPGWFKATSDTDFFRATPNAMPQQQQAPPQSAQQNSLLDLFKNAKKG